MSKNSVPRHLIHPIQYPTGDRAAHRTSAEIAAINDAHSVPENLEELEESYRIAGIRPDGTVPE